jgi:hypothetical protein
MLENPVTTSNPVSALPDGGCVDYDKFKVRFLGTMLVVAVVTLPFTLYWMASAGKKISSLSWAAVLSKEAPVLVAFPIIVAFYFVLKRKTGQSRHRRK